MNNERRAKATEIMRDIRKRRLAQIARIQKPKMNADLFEQVKEKMVMRIYGVSSERAKEIIADRVAEKAELEAESRKKHERGIRTLCRRIFDDDGE